MSILNIVISLLIGALFPITIHWLELPVLSRRGTVRAITNEEIRRIRTLSTFDSLYNNSPVYILEGTDELRTSTVADPVGLPGRRTVLIGSDFLEQGDDFIRATLALQESRLKNGVYKWKFLAKIVRMQLLSVLLVYFLPSVPPTPEASVAILLAVGTIVTVLLLSRKTRSVIYESDRQVVALCGPDSVEEMLTTYMDQTDVSRTRFRFARYFRLSPSIDDRIENIRSICDT